ncbi:hypothetical protein GIB67_013692 [Kingdonia uniflora]|uniref:DUF4283 domain-containing protein n=1 Tax=Kingdonia uniflora TaxID=39325 RepID=A0A7J7NQL9_9MAGN|nr:hypothetical protein GIB67_013692 [Kingdonia uniflora]
MDLWETKSFFPRAQSRDQNGAPTYAEMAKEQEGRSCSFEQLPTPGRRGDFPSIKVPIEAHKRGLNRNRFNLVCRLDLQKTPILEVRSKAIDLWKPKEIYRLIPVGKGYITIFLDNEEDRNKIWSGGVKFLGLGVEFWEVDTLMALGRTLGTPIQIDQSSITMDFGYFAKVLIDIDLAEPIPSKILVEVEGGDFWQRIELGVTLKFCSHCKFIGHTFAECRVIKEHVQRVEDPKKNQQEIPAAPEGTCGVSGKWVSKSLTLWLPPHSILLFSVKKCLSPQYTRSGGTGPLSSSITEFNDCIDTCRLFENHSTGSKFSWCNGQKGNARILIRLDRALYNSAWISNFKGWSCKYLARDNSDHSALVGSTQGIPKPSNIPFRFLAVWASDTSFRHLVASSYGESLDGDPLFVIMKKLQRLKVAIKVWKKDNMGDLKNQIEKSTADLEELQA